jgi:predicted nucleic acid-binding Zn ribbon protein
VSWHPEPLASVVRRELGRLGPASALGEVAERWASAVGPAIAANASPARIARDGTLHVATSSSAWAFELAHLADEIVARLRAAVGDAAPTRIRFAVGRVPEPGSAPETNVSRGVPKVERDDVSAAERIAAPIEDSELRALVARAAATSLARGRGEAADR